MTVTMMMTKNSKNFKLRALNGVKQRNIFVMDIYHLPSSHDNNNNIMTMKMITTDSV